jgi:hypothetical protein
VGEKKLMKMNVKELANTTALTVTTTCPHCGHKATLEQIGSDIHIGDGFVCGQRFCPNPNCRGHLFVVTLGQKLLFQSPPVRFSFNKTNIPPAILKTFEEAITCHSEQCFVAAAIMVRRTLEEICEERGAKGKDLKDRINDLKGKIVIPQELFDAMDELRLLGNDAAHLEAKIFDSITKPELDIAIEFTTEILKSLYQYSSLLDRLRSLKKVNP